MTYDDTLYVILNAYPDLYADEDEVLYKLFFIGSSDFEWEGGELTSDWGSRTGWSTPQELVDLIVKWQIGLVESELEEAKSDHSNPEWVQAIFVEIMEKHLETLRSPDRVARSAEETRARRSMSAKLPKARGIAPLGKGAPITRIPDDVTESWLRAVERSLDLPWTLDPLETDAEVLTQARARVRQIRSLLPQ